MVNLLFHPHAMQRGKGLFFLPLSPWRHYRGSHGWRLTLLSCIFRPLSSFYPPPLDGFLPTPFCTPPARSSEKGLHTKQARKHSNNGKIIIINNASFPPGDGRGDARSWGVGNNWWGWTKPPLITRPLITCLAATLETQVCCACALSRKGGAARGPTDLLCLPRCYRVPCLGVRREK